MGSISQRMPEPSFRYDGRTMVRTKGISQSNYYYRLRRNLLKPVWSISRKIHILQVYLKKIYFAEEREEGDSGRKLIESYGVANIILYNHGGTTLDK